MFGRKGICCQSQWPRWLRHELSSLARTLGSWIRIRLEAWMSVFTFVLGSGLATGWSLVQGVLPNVLDEETEVKRMSMLQMGATGIKQPCYELFGPKRICCKVRGKLVSEEVYSLYPSLSIMCELTLIANAHKATHTQNVIRAMKWDR
jgi:hypothetical protein